MPPLSDATKKPSNIGELIPPATPFSQNPPPIIPREQPGLSPTSLGPAPSVWTSEFDRVRQWVRPGTSQGRFPSLPTKADPQKNAASSSVATKKLAPVQSQVNTNTSNVSTLQQTAFQGPWNSTVTYAAGAQVNFGTSPVQLFTSLQAGNLGNQPDQSPAFWSTIDSVADGTVFIKGVQLAMRTIIVQNASFEASTSLINGAPPGWVANGATLSYLTSGQYAGTQSLKVAASVTGGGAKTSQHWVTKPGDQFFVSVAQKSDGVSLPNTLLIFLDATGTFISGLGASHGLSTSWGVDTASVTVPANAVSFYLTCANANAGGGGIAEFDSVLVDRFVDPTTTVSAKGSTPSNLSSGFTFTSTTSSIDLIWTGLTIFRADGSTTSVPNGSFNVTGLSPSTTYKFFPFFNELLGALNFVNPGSGGPAGSGSPAMAYLASSNLITQNQNLQSNVPLSASTGFVAATTASGSGGGSGGGSGSCVHESMLCETQRGVIPIIDVEVGDDVLGENASWQRVVYKKVRPAEIFISIKLVDGSEIICTPTHPLPMPRGSEQEMVRAQDLALKDFLITRGGKVGAIKSISVVDTKAKKVTLTVEPDHSFFASKDGLPRILCSNWLPS